MGQGDVSMKLGEGCELGLITDAAKKLAWSQHQEDLRVGFTLHKQLRESTGAVFLPEFSKSVNVSLS